MLGIRKTKKCTSVLVRTRFTCFHRRSRLLNRFVDYNVDLHTNLIFDLGYLGDFTSGLVLKMVHSPDLFSSPVCGRRIRFGTENRQVGLMASLTVSYLIISWRLVSFEGGHQSETVSKLQGKRKYTAMTDCALVARKWQAYRRSTTFFLFYVVWSPPCP